MLLLHFLICTVHAIHSLQQSDMTFYLVKEINAHGYPFLQHISKMFSFIQFIFYLAFGDKLRLSSQGSPMAPLLPGLRAAPQQGCESLLGSFGTVLVDSATHGWQWSCMAHRSPLLLQMLNSDNFQMCQSISKCHQCRCAQGTFCATVQ